jgi:hypothetical protein
MHITRCCDYFLVFVSLDADILELLAGFWCWCELVHFVLMITVDLLYRSLM